MYVCLQFAVNTCFMKLFKTKCNDIVYAIRVLHDSDAFMSTVL